MHDTICFPPLIKHNKGTMLSLKEKGKSRLYGGRIMVLTWTGMKTIWSVGPFTPQHSCCAPKYSSSWGHDWKNWTSFSASGKIFGSFCSDFMAPSSLWSYLPAACRITIRTGPHLRCAGVAWTCSHLVGHKIKWGHKKKEKNVTTEELPGWHIDLIDCIKAS